MKCDELKAEQWLDYSGEPNRCYPANKVDEAIAELKAENERLKNWPHTDNSAVIAKLLEENERLKRDNDILLLRADNWRALCFASEKALNKELRSTSRALWIVRAEMAEYAYKWWTEKSYSMNVLYYTIDGKQYEHGMKEKTLHPSEWADIWLKVKKAIKAKAEEFK